MQYFLKIGAVAGALIAASVAQTKASIVDITVRGRIVQESGQLANGASAFSFHDQLYEAHYRFDTSIPDILTLGSGATQWFYGGSTYGAPDPLVSATFKVGSITASATGTMIGSVQSQLNGVSYYAYDSANSGFSSSVGGFMVNEPLGLKNFDPSPGGLLPGSNPSLSYTYSQFFSGTAVLKGDVSSIQILNVTSAVPEPSTWAMMLLGFGGVGFMAYRLRKVAALTA
jgi:hypothetical protein